MDQRIEHLDQEVEDRPELGGTEIWECTKNDCKGWMRKSFSLDERPTCPMCESDMHSGIRQIPSVKKKFVRRNIAFGRGLKH